MEAHQLPEVTELGQPNVLPPRIVTRQQMPLRLLQLPFTDGSISVHRSTESKSRETEPDAVHIG